MDSKIELKKTQFFIDIHQYIENVKINSADVPLSNKQTNKQNVKIL